MMRPPSDDDSGRDPAAYARKVLTECGLGEPPICEKMIVKHLGLELKEFWPGPSIWPVYVAAVTVLIVSARFVVGGSPGGDPSGWLTFDLVPPKAVAW